MTEIRGISKNPKKEKDSSEKKTNVILIALVLILAAICLVLGIKFVHALLLLSSSPEKTDSCSTNVCMQAAANFIRTMNDAADPCEDFYEFACGTFQNEAIVPLDKSEVNIFSDIKDHIITSFSEIIEEPENNNDPRGFNLMKKYYKTCLNETLIEQNDLKPVKDLFQVIGIWSETNWIKISMLKQAGYDSNILIKINVDVDVKNGEKRIIYLSQPDLVLERKYLLQDIDSVTMKAYYKYVVNTGLLLGADKEKFEEGVMDLIEFSRKLANISLDESNPVLHNWTAQYNPIKIKDMQQLHPDIPWLEYINNILSPTELVDENEIVINMNPSYIQDLEKLIHSTSKRTIANYIAWKTIDSLIEFLPTTIRQNKHHFYQRINVDKDKTSRWRQCVKLTIKNYNVAFASLYARKYMDAESRDKAKNIVLDIADEMKEMILKNHWMISEAKRNAFSKYAAMDAYVGYSDELLNNKIIEKYYEMVDVDENSFIKSQLNINRLITNYKNNLLHKEVNRSSWVDQIDFENLFVNNQLSKNYLQLQPGVFIKGLIFSKNYPSYINYGALGFLIGREMFHAIDNVGSKFGKNGERRELENLETVSVMPSVSMCFIDQYSKYVQKEFDNSTFDENLADVAGLKLAYFAYNKWLKENNEEVQLPGLLYTSRQLFWISTAHLMCTKERYHKLNATFASNRFRVIGTMSNIRRFAKDFNCPVGSKMNPKTKCFI